MQGQPKKISPLRKKIIYFQLFLVVLPLLIVLGIVAEEYFEKHHKIPTLASGPLMTVLEANDDAVTLFLSGDMGVNTQTHQQVASVMELQCLQEKPDALIFLGDHIYEDGVQSVEDEKWQTHLMNYYQSACLKNIPIYAVLGNHDYYGNAQAQVDFSKVSEQWNMPARNYTVNFGQLLSLTFIDSWYLDYCLFDDNCSINYVMKSLKENQYSNWNMVVSHYPIRTASAKEGSHSRGIKGFILERILCAKDADAYLAAHAHHLEFARDEVCNMDLVISGGGGADLHPVKSTLDAKQLFAQSINGFTKMRVEKSTVQYDYIDYQNNLLFSTQTNR